MITFLISFDLLLISALKTPPFTQILSGRDKSYPPIHWAHLVVYVSYSMQPRANMYQCELKWVNYVTDRHKTKIKLESSEMSQCMVSS